MHHNAARSHVQPADNAGTGERLTTLSGAFTLVPNDIVRDERLSPTALGVMVFVLSYGPDQPLTLDDIAAAFTETREEIRAAVGELIAAGHLTPERIR